LHLGDGRRGRDPLGHFLASGIGWGRPPLLHSSGQMSQSNWALVPVDSAAAPLRLYRAGWLWSVGYLDLCEHQGKVGVASDAAQPPRRLKAPTAPCRRSPGTPGSTNRRRVRVRAGAP
jgi:hypothetical protein